jgi:hypothetical protein
MKKKQNRKKSYEGFVHGIFLVLGLVAVGCVLLITVYLVISGIPAIKEIGLFNVEESGEEDLIKLLVPGNCLVMLYGYARGAIAQITGPNPGGSLFLPSINFDQVIKNKIAAEEKSQNSASSQSASTE